VSDLVRLDFEVAIRDDPALSWKAKLVGYTLKSRMNRQGWCKTGVARLARDCGVSENTVRDGIRELEDARLLVVDRVSGRATEYTATPSRGEPLGTPSPRGPLHVVSETPSRGEPEPVGEPAELLLDRGRTQVVGEGTSRGRAREGDRNGSSDDPLKATERLLSMIGETYATQHVASEPEPIRFMFEPLDADADALLLDAVADAVAAGVAREIQPQPLCRYSAHRETGRDWITPDGRTVCGVCHPPVGHAGVAEEAN